MLLAKNATDIMLRNCVSPYRYEPYPFRTECCRQMQNMLEPESSAGRGLDHMFCRGPRL